MNKTCFDRYFIITFIFLNQKNQSDTVIFFIFCICDTIYAVYEYTVDVHLHRLNSSIVTGFYLAKNILVYRTHQGLVRKT